MSVRPVSWGTCWVRISGQGIYLGASVLGDTEKWGPFLKMFHTSLETEIIVSGFGGPGERD